MFNTGFPYDPGLSMTGFDTHFAQRVRNPDDNFAAVRNQNFPNHWINYLSCGACLK